MEDIVWLKQTADKPLFPDLLWSRPENRLSAGKLLIVGGSSHGFSSVGEAYGEAEKAGAGTIKVLLPDSLEKVAVKALGGAEFAPSTPSGSFAKNALAQLIDLSNWADGTLLVGEFGRNSETAILLESYTGKINKPVILTKDSIDYFYALPKVLLENPSIGLVIALPQLQKLLMKAGFTRPVTLGMDLLKLIDTLHELTEKYPVNLITNHLENILVSTSGKVSTTKVDKQSETWQVKTAVAASVWWLQNPTKPFEALTTSLIKIK
jgi:ADP-dependent NAD(P)H-hydrate dehydratase / NAD(P)H-hydrate epimerase